MVNCIDQCVAYNSRNRPGVCIGVNWKYNSALCFLNSDLNSRENADSVEVAILLEY